MYSAPSDEELDAIISEIQLSHPNTGYRMMKAFLHARGMLVQSKFDIKLILICTYALLDLSNNNRIKCILFNSAFHTNMVSVLR